jgi:hypothetical protein
VTVVERAGKQLGDAVTVEDVVAEDQRRRRSGDEIGADDIGLGEPLRPRLLRIGQGQAPARSVAEQVAEPSKSCGVEMIRISRIPASMSVDNG